MGTITVLSQKQGFKPVDQLEVGDEDIIGLSAPTRKDFADELLVTCHRKRLDFKDTKVYLVNVVKDRYKLVLQTNWFDPMYSDAQGHFAHDWHFAYDYNQLRAGNPQALCDALPLAGQAAAPIQAIGEDLWVLPDRAAHRPAFHQNNWGAAAAVAADKVPFSGCPCQRSLCA